MSTPATPHPGDGRIGRRALFAAGLALAGCRAADSLQLLAASRFADWEWQGPLPLTLPLREHRGWVLVQGTVNGHGPVDFVLDTGAPISVLLAGPGLPALDMARQSRLGSDDDPAAPTGAVQNDVELRLGPLRLRRHTLLAVPAASIGCRKEGQALPFQGVLGYELFNRFAAEIDRDAGVLRLHAPEQAARVARGPALAIELVDRHPFVRAGLNLRDGLSVPLRLHLDSGAGSDLTLFPGSDPALVLPSAGEEEAACFVGGQARYRKGPPLPLQLGTLPAVPVPVRYALGRDVRWSGQHGRLGARVLSRYHAVIDYPGERLFLTSRGALT